MQPHHQTAVSRGVRNKYLLCKAPACGVLLQQPEGSKRLPREGLPAAHLAPGTCSPSLSNCLCSDDCSAAFLTSPTSVGRGQAPLPGLPVVAPSPAHIQLQSHLFCEQVTEPVSTEAIPSKLKQPLAYLQRLIMKDEKHVFSFCQASPELGDTLSPFPSQTPSLCASGIRCRE